MALNNYRDEVQRFMLKLGDKAFDRQVIVAELEHELKVLKENLTNKVIVDHQIYDLLFLLMELAVHNQTDIDAEWDKGRARKKEYCE